MSKSQIQGAAGAMRKIAPLHRPALVDYEVDRKAAADAAADAPDLYAPAPRIPRERPPAAGSLYWAVVAASLVFACYLIGVHVLASWGQQ